MNNIWWIVLMFLVLF
jgi:hypothetical protein